MESCEGSPLGAFGRYLSIWVGLCIVGGILLGNIFPSLFELVAGLEYANVNLVVAVLIWVMIFPMMAQVDFSSMKNLGKRPRGLIITLVINWLIKPFSMAAIGVLFFEYLYVGWVNPQDAKEYIAGMILLGVAPCTAMVFVWSQLTRGDAGYTLVQVSINDLIMIFAFAPIAAFLLGVTDIVVPWQTLLLSVGLYVVIPLLAGYMARRLLVNNGDDSALNRFTKALEPCSIMGLLATIVILFGLQGETILEKPMIIGLIAIPLIIQTYGIFAIAYGWAYLWKVPHNVAAPAAMIGTSNFFELAVAVAISVFGLESGAALATVVGVLVEVPVMLSLVAFANRTKSRFT
ncbi:MAG: ACR3 family arsenite efflux transporter [Kordiimonadaceae bacterium]|jgi:arsenite transporter|nr:ACR3 family arsenite efflux transporter [Kordiimonadaceae bacterium]MBT6035597.1 ACR3 family arsenite efflux transporter [Kordiimonadaceae bacterium]